jgi:uncharacterized membrane protein YgcG
MWPKGYVTPPTFSQRAEYFLRDNRDAIFLATGFLVLLLYYLIAWAEVGRDPRPGIIMPLYEPPVTLSPAGMRYLVRMGFDNKTFAAAILDMAARGYLKIKEEAGSYTLTLLDKDERVLTPDEKQIAGELFEGRKEVCLHQDNHALIQAAMIALQKWLKSAEHKVYFVTNSRYLLPPVLLTLAIVVVDLLDQVEGFKMFLGKVDGDRLNRAMPPEQSPAMFEKLLPYALALDVEQDWAEKFSGVLAVASTLPGGSSTIYATSFPLGPSGGGFGGANFASSFSNSFVSAISSSSSAPGSGGGGGSGGSGGGGGGGGGGGW